MMQTNRIPLNLIFDYPVRWSKYKVLRDLLQNFFDSVPRDEWSTRFSHCLEGSRLRLTAADVGFSYDWLVPIGASTKRDGEGEHAGYFGEGFKIAALCAVRDYGWDMFGGDSSANFSHALSEMLELIFSHMESMAEFQRRWDS